jgi:Uma2 family endonuclease
MITNQKTRRFPDRQEYLSYIEDSGIPELALVDPKTRQIAILAYDDEAQNLFDTITLAEARNLATEYWRAS